MRVIMLTLLSLLLLSAGWVTARSGSGYATQDRTGVNAAASRQHPAGTDEVGRDIGVRLAVALVIGTIGAACASAIAGGAAMSVASFAAFGPRALGRVLLYGGDLFLTLPWLFLLMLVRSALPLTLSPALSGLVTFAMLALLGMPSFLRLNYQKLVSLRQADWMLQSSAFGLRKRQIGRQVIPHLRPILWTQFVLYLPVCLIAEANLGTLGLGLSEPLPSLGNFAAHLQSAALLGSSALLYLPIAVLVLVLVLLELGIFGVKA